MIKVVLKNEPMMDCAQIFPCEQSTDYKIGHRNILQGTETNKDINYTNGLCNFLFMSYCQDFLESTEINRTNPELLHFLRFLYREGVENNLRINSSDNQVQNELGEHIANFLQDIKRGKDAKDLHSSIYLFLACLLEKYLKVGNATEPKCSQYKSDQSFCIDYNKINDVSNLDHNNHRIICVPTLRILRDEFKRVMEENISLCTENHMLRKEIRQQKHKSLCECNKILQAIIRYCEEHTKSSCWCQSCVRKLPNYCCKSLCCKPLKPLCSPCSPPKCFVRSRSCSPVCCPRVKTFCCSPCKKDPCSIGPSRLGAGCSTGGCGGYTPSGWNKLMTKAKLMCDDPPCGCCLPSCTCRDCRCSLVRRRAKCRANICTDFCNSQTSPQDESGSNSKNRPSLKLLGELAFQLERRILDYVFGMEDSKRRRFYGYTVSNIFSMMEKESKSPKGGSDVITKSELAVRLKKLLTALEKYGYNIKIHGEFAQEMVNKYGLLACPPDKPTIQMFGLNDSSSIACLIQQLAQGPSEISNFTILLNCLKYLCKCDKRPLFMW